MTTNAAATGFWSSATRNNARQGRALLQSLFLAGAAAAPLTATRAGVILTNGDQTKGYDGFASVVSGQTINVAPVVCVASRPGQGPYLGWLLPTAVNVTCDAPPATNPRNDIVVMRIYDAAQGDTPPGSGPCQIEVITGSPAASPVDPVTPDSTGTITSWSGLPVPSQGTGGGIAVPLWRARVSTGGAVTLTDIRRSTGLLGGVRALLPGDSLSDASNMPGDMRWFNGLDYWDGAAWNELGRPRIGGEYQGNAQATMAASGATKMNFGATVQAASGITWNGSNQFTVVTAGVYALYAGVNTGFSATGSYGVGIHGASGIPGSTTPWLSAPTFAQGQTDAFTASEVYLAAGATLSAYFYNNEAATRLINTASSKPAVFRVWRNR
ncbi:hypothetical protein VSH64_24830 [Amycolatopsis rhabdoformis]|uniref:Uncharacterized protein n=1 Tax=Amycolatopsis rhabdoformis TaxID=1448059 RepID=A0ABZ1HWY9_9PSEU|nr:hypothetical protein [Amycolatopsis rhabdoformis]WSE26103.1 hypothetical protein VSH64_24830 [Amycolatopsis rhabdoformis]